MKKFSFWIVFSLIIVFAAGVTAGVFGDRWWFAKRPQARRLGGPHPPTLDMWTKELGLTAEQQEKIREIFKKNGERIKGMETEFYKQRGEIRSQLKSEIDAVLTAEQKQKLESMIEKMRKKYGERQRRPDSRQKQIPKKENDNEKEANHRSDNPSGYRGSHPGLRPY